MTGTSLRVRRRPGWHFGALAVLLVLPACKGEPPAPAHEPEPPPAKAAALPSASSKVFGSAIAPGSEVLLANVLANPRQFEGKTVTVQGDVRRVCKKMGCWMELATEKSETAPGCRVFFGAHQFFVPKDSDGSHARVQGEVQVKQVQADFVEHLEQEGASFKAKNADGTADEVRLVASGVELTRG